MDASGLSVNLDMHLCCELRLFSPPQSTDFEKDNLAPEDTLTAFVRMCFFVVQSISQVIYSLGGPGFAVELCGQGVSSALVSIGGQGIKMQALIPPEAFLAVQPVPKIPLVLNHRTIGLSIR